MAGEPSLIKGVLFDLDGTLLDTAADLAAGANAARAAVGLGALSLSRLVQFVGKGADRLVHRSVLDAFEGEAPADAFKVARAAFDEHYTQHNGAMAVPYPGAHQALEQLQAMGLKLGCITNKPMKFTLPLLKQQGLVDFFEPIFGGDSFPARKPDPVALLAAASAWQLPVFSVLMVGDSDNDVLAAKAAGMPVVAVPHGYNEGRPIALANPDGIVQSLLELPAFVKNFVST
jgi:phosphoglycolate phosphatase